MDTKWKSRIGILAWLVLFTYGLSGVLTALVEDSDYVTRNFFETDQFNHNIEELYDYIYAFEVSMSKEELKQSITVTKDEIEEHRYRYGDLDVQINNIEQQYQASIQEALDENNQEAANKYTEERDAKIADITKNFESDAYVKAKIVEEKQATVDDYYQELENNWSEYQKYKSTFDYYLTNTETGEVFTNLPTKDSEEVDEYISEKNMHFVRSYPTSNRNYLRISPQPIIWDYDAEIFNELTANPDALYEGAIGISKTVPNSNFILREYHNYQNQRMLFWIYTIGAVIALIISVILEKKKKLVWRMAPKKWQYLYNKLPIDAALVIFAITVMITLGLELGTPYLYYSNQITGMLKVIIYHLLTITIWMGLSIAQGSYLYPRLKEFPNIQAELQDTLLMKFFEMMGNVFINRRVATQVLLILSVAFLFGVGTILIMDEQSFFLLYVPAFFLIVVPLFIIILRRVGYFNKILVQTRALAKGEFKPDLKVKGKSVLAKLAEDINTMKYGVRTSQQAQAKSERLKTELITNVSHDLRTPLTSIMTYSELLKNPELAEDERSSYLEIIDRKSKRLKVLIDDLFEASKMASGNMELVKERIDIVQLLQQALAEYDETIQASSIQFRVSNPDKPIYAVVDGQKFWRVFENLIGNILKYSLENTRAYIQVKEENGQVMIAFKNVSKYELSDNSDELFERFKRGDESRHTDGSGLGLAIAKSIIDLHGGTLDIDVDGDLFKVTIMLGQLEPK